MRAAFKKLKNDGVNADQALRWGDLGLHGHISFLKLTRCLCMLNCVFCRHFVWLEEYLWSEVDSRWVLKRTCCHSCILAELVMRQAVLWHNE